MAESPVVAAGGAFPGAAGGRAVEVERAGGAGVGGDAEGAGRSPGLRLGRRQANVAGGRSRSFKVKVTEVEAEVLGCLAREAGVSLPRLLVETGLAAGAGGMTASERREAMVELFAVHRVLSGIAVNINQVAKATNVSREAPEARGWVATLETVRKVAFRIDEVLEVVGREQRAAGRRR